MTVEHSINGKVYIGVQANWTNAELGDNIDLTKRYSDWQIVNWSIQTMLATDYFTFVDLLNTDITSLITNGYSDRNTQTEYTSVDLAGLPNGTPAGVNYENVTIGFRAKV